MRIYVIANGEECANVGFLFDCSWDGEHALGVMTCKDEILEIGGADTAFCR